MKNLVLSNFESFSLDCADNYDAFFTDRDYILLYSKGRIIKYRNYEKSWTEIYNVTETLYPVRVDEIPEALDITYSFEKNSLFLILRNGDVVAVEFNGNTCSGDVVGSVTGGLKAFKWSPENDVVALVSGEDKVIVMTNDFDPVSEVDLHGGGFGEKQFTTVGWGKKETQFRGSEGKYMVQVDSKTECGNELPMSQSMTISWRGDGELFAVSSINPDNNERYLRIFNKEGVLQYTSEVVTGLEHSLDWRPSGNLIASTQRLPNKHNVCFFEKNGLKHGEFTLPFKQNEVNVKELMWNDDSKLLALLIEKLDGNNENIISDSGKNDCSDIEDKRILIYCMSNYHWYCKYCIPFSTDCDIKMKWDQRVSNLLHVMIKKNNNLIHEKYTWISCINKSKGNSVEDKAFVAVIDGSKLLITSFRNGILPPPLFTYSIEMSCQINQVCFAPNNSEISSNDLFVQLCNGELNLYKFESNNENSNEMTHRLVETLPKNKNFSYNYNWVSHRTICYCNFRTADSNYFLNIFDIKDSNVSCREKEYPIKSPVALLSSCCDSCIVMHDNDGKTFLIDSTTNSFNEIYPNQSRYLKELEVIQKNDKSFLILGLDKSNKFFVNDKMIANNITSFHVHQEFLLLTNLKHMLLCIPTEAEMDEIISGVELNSISMRRVERGSRLITSVPEDTKVILQMPRGNLECIQPRALSFSVIGKHLNELQFYKAFNIMRLQRINLNLLYDHNPDLFRENVLVFIEQIKDVAWISLFLSELAGEDVTKTMYSVIYKNRRNENESTGGNAKVFLVCELLEKALSKMKNADKYILPILTTYLKRGETQYIECALAKVKEMKEAENRGEKLAVTFDEAFRHMVYVIDVEDLYKVALGMYDFDLVLLVATKSQMDPKEYLPLLNDLRKLEVNYQKFMIDKYLKRYEKALKNLLQCGGDDFFTECLTFIKSHKLYKSALKLVPHTTDRYKQICANYADELMKSHSYEEAGIMFSNSGSYSNAITAFMKSGNWEEVISCSTKLNFTSQELYTDLYANLAGDLLESKRFKEASTVFMDYLQNTEMALIALCSGKMFAEAFRIAELHRRDDLVQAHIRPSILQCYQNAKVDLSTFGELFDSQRKRLKIVREKKLSNDFGEGCEGNEDEFSETSTMASQSYAGSRTTNRTFRSAKNKRKQERKLLSLKEGSPYEDLALIASLHGIVSNCLGMRTEIKELNKSLIKINEVCLAEELQKIFEKLLNEIENCKNEIWTPELIVGKDIYGRESTSNSIAAAFIQSENLNRNILINPRLLIAPEAQANVKWKLDILNP